uniref:uncharacterized protein LOC118549757 isoform X2 n=1 Tax=Halichoerus grypus TaxID=9711 RepID=UPI0016592A30|nr:uncharacterized protein LOC118549757 isoform X2 [Halichoerus grypus]
MYLFLTNWIKCQRSIGDEEGGRDCVLQIQRMVNGPLACLQYSCAFLMALLLPLQLSASGSEVYSNEENLQELPRTVTCLSPCSSPCSMNKDTLEGFTK